MGFEGRGRDRGGFRGAHYGGGRSKSTGFNSRGGSPRGGFRGRGGSSGGRDFSYAEKGRVNKHGGFKSNARGGRGAFSPRGGRGGFSSRGGRDSFSPRGREFRGSARGGRGSFSEKRIVDRHEEEESNADVLKIKKSFSATSTPVNSKKQHATSTPVNSKEQHLTTNKRKIGSDDEESDPLICKKAPNGKANYEEETDSEEQDEEYEDEDEESDEDEDTQVPVKKLRAPKTKKIGFLKKNMVFDSDNEEQDEDEDEDEHEDEATTDEEEFKFGHDTKKALSREGSSKTNNLESSDDGEEEHDGDDEDYGEDDEESEEDEEQVEPLMKTPALKQSEKVVKSVLKSGKGTDVKKSVILSDSATSTSQAKKLPTTPYPQKKALSIKETPKARLNFNDDSSDEDDDDESGEATVEDEDDDEQDDDYEDEEGSDIEDDENKEKEEVSKPLQVKSGTVKKQVLRNKHHGQSIKKKITTDGVGVAVNKGQPVQGIKKTVVDDRNTTTNKEKRRHGIEKSNVADCTAVVNKVRSGQGVKKKATDNEHARVATKEHPGLGIKRKAIVHDPAAVGSSEHLSKRIKKDAVDSRAYTVNDEQPSQSIKKKTTIGHITAVVSDDRDGHGVKRKTAAEDSAAKHLKLDENVIISEENRRRQERDERSLFIKGFPKNTKVKELEDLHSDIESVRHRKGSSFAWILFKNEASCKKAYEVLSSAKVRGKSVTVDFCGSKSAKKPHSQKEYLPVNPLELFINGLPQQVNESDIKNVFRAAVSVHIPSARFHEIKRAFVLFSSEDDAKAAFDKSKGLKLGGRSVEVFYARVRKSVTTPAAVKQKKNVNTPKTVHVSSKLVAPKVVENESDDEDGNENDEEMQSSNEGIEEVVKQQAKKVAVNKGQVRPPSDDEDDESEEEEDVEDDDYDEEENEEDGDE